MRQLRRAAAVLELVVYRNDRTPGSMPRADLFNRDGDTVSIPLYRRPIAVTERGNTARGGTVDNRSFAGPSVSAQAVVASGTFSSLQSALNGPHGSVHVLVGRQRSLVSRAGFGPIFHLDHSNVDRLSWDWQQTHPGAMMPVSESTRPLDSFDKPFGEEWYEGVDMKSTDALGCRYGNWRFWQPPILVRKVVAMKIDP